MLMASSFPDERLALETTDCESDASRGLIPNEVADIADAVDVVRCTDVVRCMGPVLCIPGAPHRASARPQRVRGSGRFAWLERGTVQGRTEACPIQEQTSPFLEVSTNGRLIEAA